MGRQTAELDLAAHLMLHCAAVSVVPTAEDAADISVDLV